MASAHASALSLEELTEIRRILDAYPIEVAEVRASDKQRAFQRAFLARADEQGRRRKVFVAMGGNRSGKSFCCGWMCFAKYVRDHAVDKDVFWCVGQTLDRSIGGQQREMWNALPRWMFGKQVWDDKGGFASGRHAKVTLPTKDGGKCLIEFRSADQHPSTFEQAKLRGVWMDERVSEEIYDRIIPRTLDLDGFILYSDIPEQWWQFERLKEADPAAGVHFVQFGMVDNASNLAAGAVDQAKLLMTADEQKLRIAGEFTVMEGVVYKEFVDRLKPDGHLVDPFPIPAYWPRWRLIDYGGSAPTACLWVAMSPSEVLYVYREHYERGLSVDRNAKMILACSEGETYVRTFMDPHAVDAPPAYYGSSPTVAAAYELAGIPSTGWPFINVMGEHALVQRVKFRFERHTILVFSSLTNMRRELRSWKYLLDKDGKPLTKDAYENDNNHTLDCVKGFLGTNPCFAAGTGDVAVERRGEGSGGSATNNPGVQTTRRGKP